MRAVFVVVVVALALVSASAQEPVLVIRNVAVVPMDSERC